LIDEHEILGDISIVIPTIGRRVLYECLGSIRRSEAWPAQLLVVDQSGSDEIAGHLEEMRRSGLDAVHLPSDARGIAIATNHGTRRAQTPIVAVTHDDCRVSVDWLRTLRDHVATAGLAVVTGRVMPEDGADVPSVMTSGVPAIYTRPLTGRDVLFPANMAFRRDVVDVVGPLDEDPFLAAASEDNEWAYRILRAGIPIVYRPDAVVTHLAWRDEEALGRALWTYARSQGAFYGKYLRGGDLFIARRAGLDLLRAVWWLTRGLGTNNPELIARGRAGSLGLSRGVVAGAFRGGPLVAPGAGTRRGTATGG
jgi:GT2 family glycosyltransferase